MFPHHHDFQKVRISLFAAHTADTCSALVQTASILTCIVATSAALFSYHCMHGQLEAASVHPPIMFCLLIVLFVLPVDAVYKVSHSTSSHLLLRSYGRRAVHEFRVSVMHSALKCQHAAHGIATQRRLGCRRPVCSSPGPSSE